MRATLAMVCLLHPHPPWAAAARRAPWALAATSKVKALAFLLSVYAVLCVCECVLSHRTLCPPASCAVCVCVLSPRCVTACLLPPQAPLTRACLCTTSRKSSPTTTCSKPSSPSVRACPRNPPPCVSPSRFFCLRAYAHLPPPSPFLCVCVCASPRQRVVVQGVH